MSIFIYIDENLLSLYKEKIEFFNSFLSLQGFRKNTFFKYLKIKIIKNYENELNLNNSILLPNDINLSFREKIILKQPKNIIKYPDNFLKFGTMIFFKKNSLKILNDNIACFFKKGYFKKDIIYLITNREDLFFYEDIIKGIGSKKIKFIRTTNLNETIINIISDYINKELEEYLTAFKLGTTALLDYLRKPKA